MTFENSDDLKAYISTKKYPKELCDKMLESMERVEECIDGGACNASLCITESEEEKQEVIEKYNLATFIPEFDESFIIDGDTWNRKVFIFDDAGGGIILYNLLVRGNKRPDFTRSANGIINVPKNEIVAKRGVSRHRNRRYTFDKKKRYMTRSIAETFPDRLKILLWQLIDEDVQEFEDTDYLQVFTFEKIGQGMLAIKREQEKPLRKTVLYVDYCVEYKEFINKKIFVIDDTEYSIMLYAEEY